MFYHFYLFYYQPVQVKAAWWESEYTKIWDEPVLNAKVCEAVKVTLTHSQSLKANTSMLTMIMLTCYQWVITTFLAANEQLTQTKPAADGDILSFAGIKDN